MRLAQVRPSKYRAHKCEYKGMMFDSKRELRRYMELEYLQKIGTISELQRQVSYTLIPSQRDPDTRKVVERPCTYKADFVYKQGGETVVEDTKGVRTKDYTIKRKLMLERYHIRIREV